MNSNPKVMQVSQLAAGRDLSGGVRIALGGNGFVLSPQEAIRFAEGILKAAGCNVELDIGARRVSIRPRLVS